MPSSGTWTFSPSSADLMLNAFGRIGLRRTELTQQHLSDAAVESNLVQVTISNKNPNLWLDELYEVPLVAGVATYTLLSRFLSPMAVYLTTANTGGQSFDRILGPLSTFDYASIPNKEQQAPPTAYYYDRKITPTITFWPVPDDSATYTLKMKMLSQPEDVSIPNGVTLNFPYRWLDCFTAMLAHRLSRLYARDLEMVRKADAAEAWQVAATEDYENVPMNIFPALGGYFR